MSLIFSIFSATAKLGDNINIIKHKVGHLIDYELNLCNDPELIKIYKSEISNFNSHYTQDAGEKFIDYFSQTSKGKSGGLSEIIAETYMLLNTCGKNNGIYSSRSQILVHNFPKTIAYIASKFGLYKVNKC